MILFILAIVCVLGYIIFQNRLNFAGKIADVYWRATAFEPTRFIVYDKSRSGDVGSTCNRMIVVQPFDWIIVADDGKVFVVDNNVECEANETPVLIPPLSNRDPDTGRFYPACLQFTVSSLLSLYQQDPRTKIYVVPYDVERVQSAPGVLTALDCLQYLGREGFITQYFGNDANAVRVRMRRGTYAEPSAPMRG